MCKKRRKRETEDAGGRKQWIIYTCGKNPLGELGNYQLCLTQDTCHPEIVL